MNNNLIDHEQEGFLTKKSITRSLYRLKLEYEMLARDKKKAAFINRDLENAFDSVWHNWFCSKYGLQESEDFSLNTEQVSHLPRVVKPRLDDVISHPFKPKQGVEQGSVRLPLLLVFYIADMLNNITGKNLNMRMTHRYSW